MTQPEIKDSQIVIALADLASKGKYDNVTPMVAQQMNELFAVTAGLINRMEAAEAPETCPEGDTNEKDSA